MAPMARVAWLSVLAVQWTPVSRVSQIPPCAAPINQCALLVGSTAILVTRPEEGCAGAICKLKMGEGPMFTHCGVPPTNGLFEGVPLASGWLAAGILLVF